MNAPAELPSRPEPSPGAGLLAGFALALPLFLLDLVQEGDVALAVLYGLPVLLALRVPGRVPSLGMAALCTAFAVIGGLFPVPESWEWQIVLKNRSIGMLAIWGTAVAGLRVREMARAADRGQAQLQESEARFRSIFNTVQDPVLLYSIGPDGRPGKFLEANEAATRTYGYTLDELCGMTVSDLVSARDVVERVPELVERARREQSVLVESEHRTKDGRRIPVDVRVQLIEFDGREAVLAVARDITERKEAEQALQEALAKAEEYRTVMEAMMEHIPAGIIIADAPDVRIRAVSRFAREVSGRSRAEIEGIPVPLHAERWQLYRADGVTLASDYELPLTRAILQGEIVHEEEWVLGRDDGSRIPVLSTAAPIRDADGRITGGVVGWQDISARKRIEEALRESERRERARADELAALMEAVPAIVFIAHDPEGRCITGNPAACEMLRMPAGSNLSQSAPAGESPRDYCSYDGDRVLEPDELPVQRAARGEELWGCEECLRFNDGSEVHLFGNAVPLRDNDGRVRGALAAAVDVSQRKQIEQQLHQLAEQLEQRVEARTAELHRSDEALAQRTRQLQQLTSQLTQAEQRERRRLAHILHDDIQQMLTAVKIQLGLLESADPDAIPATVRRLTDHLDEAIQSARVLSHELSPQILYDAGLCEALRWLTGRKKEKYDLELEVQVDRAAEPRSEDLKILLFQAVRELLLNVVKHAGVREASIVLRPSGPGELCLSVSDQGSGFDSAEARPQVSGADHLGLFGIRERLEVVGGRMSIASAPGRGTTVCLYAPTGDPTTSHSGSS